MIECCQRGAKTYQYDVPEQTERGYNICPWTQAERRDNVQSDVQQSASAGVGPLADFFFFPFTP